MLVDINDLRKVKGIGEKTIERIKETLCEPETEYISQYDPDKHLDINDIYLGDCLDLMNGIPDKSIDMILCDLPYGTTACKWDTVIPFDPLWSQYKRIIKANGAIVLFGSEPFASRLRMSNLDWYKYDWVWDKITGTGHLVANFQPLKRVESIIVFGVGKINYFPIMRELSESEYVQKIKKISKKPSYTSNSTLTPVRDELSRSDRDLENYKFAYPDNVLVCSKYKGECNNIHRLHPTQKPVSLLEYLIKTYTNEKELVLDNCIGSGSTAIAAINTGRNYIGMEKDPEYYEIAKKRIEEHKSTTI